MTFTEWECVRERTRARKCYLRLFEWLRECVCVFVCVHTCQYYILYQNIRMDTTTTQNHFKHNDDDDDNDYYAMHSKSNTASTYTTMFLFGVPKPKWMRAKKHTSHTVNSNNIIYTLAHTHFADLTSYCIITNIINTVPHTLNDRCI